MRVDFFHVETAKGVSMDSIFAGISKLPADKSRVQQLDDDTPYRMQSLTKNGANWEGEIIRIRMNDVPIICSLAGDVDEVELDPDEGIGEETAFSFDTKTGVLALQRNRFGVSHSRLMKYVERASGIEPLLPVMIMRKDVTAELARLQIVRKFHVRFANIRNPMITTSHKPSAKTAVDLYADNVPVVDITLAMGHNPGTLSLAGVRGIAKRLAKWARDGDAPVGDVESVKLEGKFDDDSPANLDLLEFRMWSVMDIKPDPKTRRLMYADRISAIRKSFAQHQADLIAMFTPPKKGN